MRTIGLIGGMSAESTLIYYRLINEGVRARLGGHHSPELVLWSVDFAGIESLQRAGAWDKAGAELAAAARKLETVGAKAIVLCTNTMHVVAPAIAAAVRIPFLHIADATGAALRAAGRRASTRPPCTPTPRWNSPSPKRPIVRFVLPQYRERVFPR